MSTETHPESIVTPQQCNHSGPASQAIYDHVMRILDNPHRWSVSEHTNKLKTDIDHLCSLSITPYYDPMEEKDSKVALATISGPEGIVKHQFPANQSPSILERMEQVAKAIKDTEANTAAQKFLDLLTQPATR